MDILGQFTGDGNSTMVGLLVFLAAGTLAFTVMAVIRVQGSVKRRAADLGQIDNLDRAGGARSLRHSSLKAAQRLVEYTSKHYASGNSEESKVLRRRMIQAGIYDTRAVAYFFLARTALAIGLAALAFLFVPAEQGGPVFWLLVGLGGIVGYIGPSFYIDRRIATRRRQLWTRWQASRCGS